MILLPDGKGILTAGLDGTVRHWDAGTGKELARVSVLREWRHRETGAVLPERLRLVWPGDALEVTLTLGDIRVNAPVAAGRAARPFSPPAPKP